MKKLLFRMFIGGEYKEHTKEFWNKFWVNKLKEVVSYLKWTGIILGLWFVFFMLPSTAMLDFSALYRTGLVPVSTNMTITPGTKEVVTLHIRGYSTWSDENVKSCIMSAKDDASAQKLIDKISNKELQDTSFTITIRGHGPITNIDVKTKEVGRLIVFSLRNINRSFWEYVGVQLLIACGYLCLFGFQRLIAFWFRTNYKKLLKENKKRGIRRNP